MASLPTSQQLAEWLANHKNDLVGAALAVISNDGQIESATIGRLCIDKGKVVNTSTPFMLGSICKVLTATLVLQLVEQGKIGLDDSIVKWLPETKRLYPRSNPEASIRQILGHTGGLVDLFEPVKDLDDAVAKLAAQGLVANPGEIVSYSNAGYMLLGALLERITACDWKSMLRSRILDPLQPQPIGVVVDTETKKSEPGKSAASVDPPPAEDPPVAEDHVRSPDGTFTQQLMWPRFSGLFAAAGTVTAASVIDSAALLRGVLWGNILTLSSRREMAALQYRLPGPSLWCEGWGLGWSVVDAGRGLLGHMGGSSTFMLGSREMGKGVVFLSNTANGALVGRQLALRALGFEETQIPAMIRTPIMDGNPVDKFRGRYGIPVFFCDILASDDEPGNLLVKSSLEQGETAALQHVSGSTFIGALMSIPTEFTFVFRPGDTEARYLHAGFRALTRIPDN
ncbi:beta-lactamase/transpeptidase-like protein [Thelonectria olida]|uniref:Beta-lactamase/transpeptidase-like protein n=1 Tax=Thelonectria olida TaxID=1576542 RepID=A0A9P8W4K9_9HYPO|nr:beta-lactamase/transpeptidase-like protein [Thelonectria olida]